jgi:hypothetical protein
MLCEGRPKKGEGTGSYFCPWRQGWGGGMLRQCSCSRNESSTLLHPPPLRLHWVGGCWDRTQDWQSDALTTRLDLIQYTVDASGCLQFIRRLHYSGFGPASGSLERIRIRIQMLPYTVVNQVNVGTNHYYEKKTFCLQYCDFSISVKTVLYCKVPTAL